MGGLCSRPQEVSKPTLRIKNRYSTESDLIITPSNFVKGNTESFYKFYKLDDHQLGQGAWGQVRKCIHKATGEIRVVKMISKADLQESAIIARSAIHEAEILKKLDHPNLPRIYEFFENDCMYYIVIEYCNGGDLFDRIIELKTFTESQAAEIINQILLSVNYLHSKGFVHRDIKPENILMSDKETLALKLIDFDTAAVYRNATLQKMYGTPLYMAPEILKGKYNEKCDLWSCGVILHILLTGGPPYDGTDDEIFKLLKNVKINFKEKSFDFISPEAIDLLKKLLQPDPRKRISAVEACNHPWLSKYKQPISDQEILDVLNNIKNFRKTSKIKEAIHTFIISKVADQSIYQTEKAVFHLLDSNRDGTISEGEFVDLMTSKGLPNRDAVKHANKIMLNADSDKSGFVDYTEFLRASVTSNKVLTKENIIRAFKVFDYDQSGAIEVEELKEWLTDGITVTEALVRNIIAQVDKNGDGKIDLTEFEGLLLENISRRSMSVEYQTTSPDKYENSFG